MPFVKLDCGILDSTIWCEDPGTCKVWITVLAMADANGLCPATAPGIARRANMPLDQTRKAVEILEAPDPDSRTPADEGRRIVRVDGGYQVNNYDQYRKKDHGGAERAKRYRSRIKEKVTHDERDSVIYAEAYKSLQKNLIKESSSEISSELKKSALAPEPNGSGITIQCAKNGVEWEVTNEKIAEWSESYPGVDVPETLIEIRQWCRDNPKKRKTLNGMTRFIGAWMARVQNS